MIEALVRYLHDAGVPFRLVSHPGPEALPAVAQPIPEGAVVVETRVVLADGRPALAALREGTSIEPSRLSNAIGASIVPTDSRALPDEYRAMTGPIPPLGGLFGMPLFVDDEIAEHAMIVFRAFGTNDYVELAYEDFARIERPRVTSFAGGGELPPYAPLATTAHAAAR